MLAQLSIRRMSRSRALLALVLLCLAAATVRAEEDRFACAGRVVDAANQPVVGYRVVYRVVGGTDVRISAPTNKNGEYSLELPADQPCAPVAVIAPDGRRIEILGDKAPVKHVPLARRDLRLDVVLPTAPGGIPRINPGADRLFLSFVEDAAIVERQRWEAQIDYGDWDTHQIGMFKIIGAFQFSDLPNAEFGFRAAWASLDVTGDSGSESGLADTDLWFKLHLGATAGQTTDFAVGGLLTFPTGDEQAGLSYDALRSKIFGVARFTFSGASLSLHAGARFNEDSDVGGTLLEGQIAPVAGLGLVIPLSARTTFVFEGTYEGERFRDGDREGSALSGLNLKLTERGTLRLAVAGGFSSGSPDIQGLVGYAMDF